MEKEPGLHLPVNNQSNNNVALLDESLLPVIKIPDPMRGALPAKESRKVSKRSLADIMVHPVFAYF